MIASSRSNLIIGYHGCEKEVGIQLLLNPYDVKKSKKPFDWLGHGFYIWENNYDRALAWARDKKKKRDIKHPFVVGVILTLDHCLDLLDSQFIEYLSSFYPLFKADLDLLGISLPENKDVQSDAHKDLVIRELDCSLLEYMHSRLEDKSEQNFDTVRGVFEEGGPAFPGAGIQKKSHIQICVRNVESIKGFFLPKEK